MKNIKPLMKLITRYTFSCYERYTLLCLFSEKRERIHCPIIKHIKKEKKIKALLSFDVGKATQKLIFGVSAKRRPQTKFSKSL